jgi:hypothetical protein
MPGNPEFLRNLEQRTNLPVRRVTYLADATPDAIHGIDRGIVFLMAFWSGYAVRAFVELKNVLARLSVEELEVVVVDVDGAEQLAAIPELKEKLLMGYGETYWVRRGKIVAKSRYPLSDAQQKTESLLCMP